MTPDNFILVLTLASAMVSALILVPLARIIPWRMMTEWQEAIIDHGQTPVHPLNMADVILSTRAKIAMCVAGGVLGLIASTSNLLFADRMQLGGYLLGLLLLVVINLKHKLLPDQLVFLLLWTGLLRGVGTDHGIDFVLGAMAGYLVPFVFLRALKLKTGKTLFGDGDVKTLAMAGAWVGLASLPLLFGAFACAVILFMIVDAIAGRAGPHATGPAHLAASLVCLFGTRLI